MENSGGKQGLWVDIYDLDTAKKAAHQGAGASFFCAGITLLLILINMMFFSDAPILGVGMPALLDVTIIAAIGIGILNFSRVCAVAGLLIYWGEQIYAIQETGRTNWIMLTILTIAYINGIRGCFAYHNFK